MNKRIWEKEKIIKEIQENGYYIFENFFTEDALNEIKHSLIQTLHYIKKDNETDLTKKYYTIKKFNPKLKGNWYDISNYNLTLFKHLHSEDVINFMKAYFNTEVLFSARPCIHVHDETNDFLLEPHQETNMISRDGILLWSPIYDTNEETGGLTVFKGSHKGGFYEHKIDNKKAGKKSWTKDYTHIEPSILNKFEKMNHNVKSRSADLMINSTVHCGYQMKKKEHARITITERYNPLQKIPFLKKENAPLKIPYQEDYNKITE